jgi:hypothetical protein
MIGSTVHPSLLYRTAIVPLTPAAITSLDRACLHAQQRQAHMSTSSPLWMWAAHASVGGTEYDSLYRKTVEAQLTSITLWLTDPATPPTTLAIHARLAAHGLTYGLPLSPLFLAPEHRPPPKPINKNKPLTLCEALYGHCHHLGIRLIGDHPPAIPPRWAPRAHPLAVQPIRTCITDKDVWAEAEEGLRTLDILYITDITGPTGQMLTYEETTHRSLPGKRCKVTPRWYDRLKQHLTSKTHPNTVKAEFLPDRVQKIHTKGYKLTPFPGPPPPRPGPRPRGRKFVLLRVDLLDMFW